MTEEISHGSAALQAEIERLRATSLRTARGIEQLRRKFDRMHRALLELSGASVVPFDSPLSDLASVETRFVQGAEITVLAFGGMLTNLGMPPKEFFKSIMAQPCNLIFVKDFSQSWYQHGLLGLSTDRHSTIAALSKIIPDQTRKLRVLGTSAGAFGSIFFGVSLGADRVLAFGPQTHITQKVFVRFGSIDSRQGQYDFTDPSSDLLSVFETNPGFQGGIEVYYGDENALDLEHALRLQGKPGVVLIPMAGVSHHNVAMELKTKGELEPILAQLCQV